MAILSLEDLYSDEQAITATAASTNIIDHGAPGTWVHSSVAITDEKGNSMIPLAIQVTEDFNNLTSLDIAFQIDTDAAFSSATTRYTETIALASLIAGQKTSVRMIPFNSTEWFSRIGYTVTGSAPTTGKITAGIICLETPWGNR